MRLVSISCALLVGLCGCAAGGGTNGSSSGSTGSTDGGSTSSSSGAPVGSAPVLASVEARPSGRTGSDLRFAVSGHDQDLNIMSVSARLLDAQGAALPGAESAQVAPLEDAHRVGENVTAGVVLHGAAPGVVQVAVKLLDATGLSSNELTVQVLEQTVRGLGDGCSPEFLTDRCAPGLGCRGTTPTCQEGLAPQISRLAFLTSGTGAVIVLEGTEPEDDLSTITFGFQDAAGQPVMVDIDGDGTPEATTFEYDASKVSADGSFYVWMKPADNLSTLVPVLTATPRDGAGHEGVMKTTRPGATPVRASGQTCDPRGFDVCGPNLVCSPGIVGGTNKCMTGSTIRDQACHAAPVLVATTSGATLVGVASGVSLWDAPTGCSSNDPKNRPEGAVTLRLTARTNTLTLSTDHPGTTYDTVLYMLTGCPADSVDAFGCSDDIPGGTNASSTLVVQNVPAGDYLVVVDSFGFQGGSFELSAQVE